MPCHGNIRMKAYETDIVFWNPARPSFSQERTNYVSARYLCIIYSNQCRKLFLTLAFRHFSRNISGLPINVVQTYVFLSTFDILFLRLVFFRLVIKKSGKFPWNFINTCINRNEPRVYLVIASKISGTVYRKIKILITFRL